MTILMRWVDRCIGIVSTLILARILVPDDFGIVAMASVVVAFVDIIFDLGINVAIIQRKSPSQAYYDTAWTLRIIQASCVATLLVIAAPFAADYYDDLRVTSAVQLMALSILILAFENVGIITFQKELNFIADAKFVLFKRLFGFCVTIILTLVLENYWGMILGALCGRLASTVRSYWVHPMRPSFCLQEFKEIFSISQWVLVKNVSQYLDRNLHLIVVGGIARTSVTGGYTLANEISDIPGTDLLAPINRVLFPAFARARDNMRELTRLLIAAQGVQVLITFPACVGFAMTAREFVPVALGEKWIFIVPFIQILALSNIIQSISSSANYVLTVVGQIRLLALTSWIQILLFGAGLLLMRDGLAPELVAQIRFSAIVLTFGVSYYLLMKHVPGISLVLMLKGVVRPALGCIAIVAALSALDTLDSLAHVQTWLLLLAKVLTGAIVYCTVVMLLWLAAGRPEGAELFFLNKLKRNKPQSAAIPSEAK
ncbi:lipopolysaccharide biosynthesis protein [Massilia consociata]|uniref:Lipopolysaccharide biosynthesis protein n=1 Tax=Massilia consociata TaxID=760117 RepID=A0ABV6FBL9_9BURK